MTRKRIFEGSNPTIQWLLDHVRKTDVKHLDRMGILEKLKKGDLR